MRWIVEVSPLRPSLTPGDVVPPDTYVVEGKSWQQALQTARDFAGSTGPISQISIELLPEGYRAIDPVGRMRYVIKRAPEDAATTSPGRYSVREPVAEPVSGPATEVQKSRSIPPSPRSQPPGTTPPSSTRVPKAATMALDNAAAPPAKAPSVRPPPPSVKPPPPAPTQPSHAPPAVTASPVAASARVKPQEPGPAPQPPPPRPDSVDAPTRSPVAQSIASPGMASTPAPARIPTVAPTAPVVSQKVDLNATQKSAAMVDPLPTYEVMVSREEEPSGKSPITYREYAYVVPSGTPDKAVERLIRACFLEVLATLRTAPAGKLVNLAVFDVVFTGKPPRPPLATLAWKDWRGPEPEIRFPARERALAAAAAAPASQVSAATVSQPPAVLPPPPPPAPAMMIAEPAPADPIASNGAGAAAHAAPTSIEELDVEMDPTPAQAPAAPPPVPAAAVAAPAPVASPPAAAFPPPAAAVTAATAQATATTATSKQDGQGFDPFASGRKKSTPSIRVAAGQRLSGEELLGDLFEAMHDLHFMQSTLDGAHFVLSLAMEKLPSRVAICHFFDINKREFVVVHAIAKTRDALVLTRIPEKDPLATQTLNRRRAIVIPDAATDGRVKGARYDALGTQVLSVVTAPVALGGRYLGMLELVNPADGGTFVEGDGYALSYMGEQFAEFLGQRGVLIEPDVIKAFKPH